MADAYLVSEGDTNESSTPPDMDVKRILAAHGGQCQSAVTLVLLLRLIVKGERLALYFLTAIICGGGEKGRESKRDRVGRIERDKKRVRERVRKSENR